MHPTQRPTPSPQPCRTLPSTAAALLLRVLVAASLGSGAAACSPQQHVVGGGAGPVITAPVHLAAGNVRADLTVVGDATRILRESIGDSLEEAKMTCSGAGCGSIDLNARLVAPARAFTGTSPPLRIVELLATYHAPGAQRAGSTVSYQRTVAVNGNLSTATWLRISDALTTDLTNDFGFRSSHSGIVVRLPSWATMPTNLPRTGQPKAFHVAITSDSRADDDAIGSIGNREVRLARRATDYITEMLTDELRGAGHLIVPAKDGRLVGSELEKFWVSATQSGLGGWETRAEIQLDLEVAPPPGVKRKKAERHSCTASEKSSHMPGEPDLARVLERCLLDLATSIRNDSAWSLGQG